MYTTGLVHVGKGRQQYMSKLQNNADDICAVQGACGVHVCALRALVLQGLLSGFHSIQEGQSLVATSRVSYITPLRGI